MLVTVCTPTYNRAYCLMDLYRSLQKQSINSFEWLVIDDGSSDKTGELVWEWIKVEENFPIRYFYKENGGKHTALNLGMEQAEGDCFIIVDSDDMLSPDAIEQIVEAFKNLPRMGFAGVGFNRIFTDGSLVGTTFSGEYVDATSLERPRYKIGGDKAEVFWTSILKQFPFPVFAGERFLTEALVWNRIAAAGYKLRWYNKGIYICEYRADGLSMNANTLDSFQGYTLSIKELLSYEQASLVEKVRCTGVYAWVAKKKQLSLAQTAKQLDTSAIFVLTAGSLYKLKRILKPANRVKQFRITR